MIAIHTNTHEPFNECGVFIGDYCVHFADTFGTYSGYLDCDIVSNDLREVIRADMAKTFPGAVVVFRDVSQDEFDEMCRSYNEIAPKLVDVLDTMPKFM